MNQPVTKRIVQLSRRIEQQTQQMRRRGHWRRDKINKADANALDAMLNEFEMLSGFRHETLAPI